MTETYTSGVWVVKPGEEDDFVEAWKEFVAWAAGMPGSGTFLLVRDLDRSQHFMSFAPWESFEAQQAWKRQPEFVERINRVRARCEDFHPSTYELVTDVS
jgi:heme-degrading monooxygenase HmoA